MRATGAAAAGLTLAAPFGARAQDIRGRAMTRDVMTSSGRVRGVLLEDDIQAFYGVPYGASTGGANRFMPPKPPAPWTGIRETIQVANRAPQQGERPSPAPTIPRHDPGRDRPIGAR